MESCNCICSRQSDRLVTICPSIKVTVHVLRKCSASSLLCALCLLKPTLFLPGPGSLGVEHTPGACKQRHRVMRAWLYWPLTQQQAVPVYPPGLHRRINIYKGLRVTFFACNHGHFLANKTQTAPRTPRTTPMQPQLQRPPTSSNAPALLVVRSLRPKLMVHVFVVSIMSVPVVM